MNIEINDYIVNIKLVNGFTKREITKARIELLTIWIDHFIFFGNFDIWTDKDFPENIEDETKWDEKNYGVVFEWNVIDYIKKLYPQYEISDKNLKICYQYHYHKSDYESSIEFFCFKEKQKFSKEYKLLNIGYCTSNLFHEIKN